MLACAGVYSLVNAPGLPLAQDQTQPVATTQVDLTATPPENLTPQITNLPGAGGTPTVELTPTLTTTQPVNPTVSPTSNAPYLYYVQAGDTLKTLAIRFAVDANEITSPVSIPQTGLINPGQLLIIPRKLYNTSSATQILPDSEVVNSPSAIDFDIDTFVKQAGGYLSTYSEYLGTTGTTSGAQVIERVATEFSVNPRLLLALLEYQSHWVYGQPTNLAETDYPMGHVDITTKGLYFQMSWAVSKLSEGYYGWRDGSVTEVTFPDKTTLRLAPDLNAGSVGLQYLFANMYDLQRWAGALDPKNGFPALEVKMFGDPWLRSQSLYPANLTQPVLTLPFDPGAPWSFSGGPHAAFGAAGALAALDFAPAGVQNGCYVSDAWVAASAGGLVVRAGYNQVVIDLNADGHEQTGWTILYLHIATDGMIAKGTHVSVGDHIGHPSCEGGEATGVNLHVARKFNGEWMPADSAIPFVMSGWQAHAGDKPYAGTLTNGNQVVTADTYGAPETDISLPRQP